MKDSDRVCLARLRLMQSLLSATADPNSADPSLWRDEGWHRIGQELSRLIELRRNGQSTMGNRREGRAVVRLNVISAPGVPEHRRISSV